MAQQSAAVNEFLRKLDHPLHAEIEEVRLMILNADEGITEHIKWNAPSFCFHGVDRITMRLHPTHQLQLVFHRGAKVRSDRADFHFADDTGLLKWVTDDRATVTLRTMEDVQANATALVQVVQHWIAQ